MRAHSQRLLEQAHVFIQRAEEGFNLSGNVNGTSHPIRRFSCYRNRLADGIPPGCACLPKAGVTALQPTQGETSSTLTQPYVAVKLVVRDAKPCLLELPVIFASC